MVQAEPQTSRVGVVGGLRHVHIVVRVERRVVTLLLAHVLQRQVGHDLVRVHVQRGTRPALEGVDGELIHTAPIFKNLVTGPDNGLRLRLRQRVEAPVGQRRRLLHLHHAPDKIREVIDGLARDVEVVHRAQGVDAVVHIGRNIEGAKQVFFFTSAHAAQTTKQRSPATRLARFGGECAGHAYRRPVPARVTRPQAS